MAEAIQVYDGDGDNRTEEQRAFEAALESIRKSSEKARAEMMKNLEARGNLKPEEVKNLDVLIKEQTDKMIEAARIPLHLLKFK